MDIGQVFISHSSKDKSFVEKVLLPLLHEHGIRTWYAADDILTAQYWETMILSALRQSDWVVVVLSPNAVESDWVQTEVAWALENRPGHVVPILYQDCDFAVLSMKLLRIQYVDFSRDPERATRKLIERWESEQPVAPGPRPAPEAGPPPVTGKSSGSDNGGPAPETTVRVPRFHFGGVVPPEYFIDRVSELHEGNELVRQRHSFLLVGDFRTGKTSFGQTLIHRIMSENDRYPERVLCVYLNLQKASHLSPETFLEHTILSMIGEVARQVFGCRYVDLIRGNTTDVRDGLRTDHAFEWFFQIYQVVRKRTHTSPADSPEPLMVDEFLAFIAELVDILHEKGWHHFFVFYDEANRLPLDLSVDIVASNEEALCAAGVVNAYSTAPNASVLSQFTGVFGHQIRLRPFQSVDDLRELLYRYYFPNEKKTGALPATENAILAVWEMSRAQPYQIQLLAGNAFRLAHEEGSNLLHSRHVRTAADVLRSELPHVFDYLDRR